MGKGWYPWTDRSTPALTYESPKSQWVPAYQWIIVKFTYSVSIYRFQIRVIPYQLVNLLLVLVNVSSKFKNSHNSTPASSPAYSHICSATWSRSALTQPSLSAQNLRCLLQPLVVLLKIQTVTQPRQGIPQTNSLLQLNWSRSDVKMGGNIDLIDYQTLSVHMEML